MIDSAIAFLPDSMTTFMNFERSTEPNFGSGRISRLGTSRRRGMESSLFRFQLGAPFGTRLEGPSGPFTYSPDRLIRFTEPVQRTGFTVGEAVLGEALRLLGPLGAILRARLLAILDALQIERAAHDVVAH